MHCPTRPPRVLWSQIDRSFSPFLRWRIFLPSRKNARFCLNLLRRAPDTTTVIHSVCTVATIHYPIRGILYNKLSRAAREIRIIDVQIEGTFFPIARCGFSSPDGCFNNSPAKERIVRTRTQFQCRDTDGKSAKSGEDEGELDASSSPTQKCPYKIRRCAKTKSCSSCLREEDLSFPIIGPIVALGMPLYRAATAQTGRHIGFSLCAPGLVLMQLPLAPSFR